MCTVTSTTATQIVTNQIQSNEKRKKLDHSETIQFYSDLRLTNILLVPRALSHCYHVETKNSSILTILVSTVFKHHRSGSSTLDEFDISNMKPPIIEIDDSLKIYELKQPLNIDEFLQIVIWSPLVPIIGFYALCSEISHA